MAGRVTRNDVAIEANTSTAVVSYVLNNGPRAVAPATRQRVLDAVARLGYRPNSLAAGLRAQRTNLVGLVVPDLTRPFFAEMATRLASTAQVRGLTALLTSSAWSAERERSYIAEFIGLRVRGVAIAPAELEPAGARLVLESGTRLVLLSGSLSLPGVPTVTSDGRASARLATRHLLEHGHERVVCLTGPQDAAPVGRRVEGWREELRASGHGAQTVLRAGFDRYSAERVAGAFLQEQRGPVAVMAATDELALGLLAAAARLGRQVPRDCAVVGCDGIPEGLLTRPVLTTVAEPIDELCQLTIGCLLAEEAPPSPLVSAAALRLGGSCGCEHPG